MNCNNCKAANPEGKKYCGDCGAALDLSAVAKDAGESAVQQRIRVQAKDQKLVEVELIEAVVNRLSNWAKLFGFFVGIPVALFLALLGLLGYKTYSDFKSLIDTGKEEITKKLDEAQKQVQTIKNRSDGLEVEYKKVESRLAEFGALDQKVGNLETAVGRIATKVGVDFEPSAALTPELKSDLESSLVSYTAYLEKVGIKTKVKRVTVDIDPKLKNTTYNPSMNRITLGISEAKDKNVVLATYTYHVLRSLRSDLFDSDKQDIQSMFVAFGDYFACSFTKKPVLGEGATFRDSKKPYIRNLDNKLSFSTIGPQTSIYDAAEIWGGAFWEIRQIVGQAITDKLLFSTWMSMRPSNVRSDYAKKILEADQTLEDGKHIDTIRSVFSRRGLNL
jgi:hypothetical protein